MKLSLSIIRSFQTKIWNYYKKNGRDLPWRNTSNPYKIFISEVMLQQTQVERVIPKYKLFLKAFPDVFSLAKSDLSSVLKAWSGLGYNRRARFLWETAQIMTSKYNGKFPKDPQLLDALPGIGKATACSILVFAYNIPLVFIETNIRRVFIYSFFSNSSVILDLGREDPHIQEWIPGQARNDNKIKIHDNALLPIIEQTLDTSNPREWYFALMDYGAYLGKKRENPNKRSAHYSVQSKFEGSTRQLRGKILKVLISKKSISVRELKNMIGMTTYNVNDILSKLQSDKLIQMSDGHLSIQ